MVLMYMRGLFEPQMYFKTRYIDVRMGGKTLSETELLAIMGYKNQYIDVKYM